MKLKKEAKKDIPMRWDLLKLEVRHYHPLCEKYPNTEFFLVRIFPHSDWIRRDTKYLSLRIQSECGKYEPEKTPYLDTFHAVITIEL